MFIDDPIVQHEYENYKKAKRKTIMRIQSDLSEIETNSEFELYIPDPNDIRIINICIKPDEGSFWAKSTFLFEISIPTYYPYERPTVKALSEIMHPNIIKHKEVCLNIVKEDWQPFYTINHIIQGLLSLMYSPVFTDPLNKEAADYILDNIQIS